MPIEKGDQVKYGARPWLAKEKDITSTGLAEFLKETRKAYKLKIESNGEETWLPKSQVDLRLKTKKKEKKKGKKRKEEEEKEKPEAGDGGTEEGIEKGDYVTYETAKWLASKKEIPTKGYAELLKETAKAYRLKVKANGKRFWLPKSQGDITEMTQPISDLPSQENWHHLTP